MNFLLTGSTGFIGKELREILLREGHHVKAITRSPKKHQVEGVKNEVFLSWDDDLVSAINDTDVIINLVGENVFGQRWDEDVKKKIYESRINNTRALVEAIAAAESKPELFISASAVGYYGDEHGDRVLDESSPSGSDFLAKVTIDWEAEALKAKAYGVRVALPRIGVVLEQGGGAIEKMLLPFSLFVGGPIGSGKQYMPWVHRTDACNAILFPISSKELEGPFNVSAPNPVMMDEFASTLGHVMHRPSLFRVPEFAINLILGESAQPVLSSLRVQPKKLQSLGFQFEYEELEEALNDIL